VLGAALLGCGVRGLLYPAPPVAVPSPPPAPLVEVRLAAPGGEPVVAWAGASSSPVAPVVVFFHGNGENLETMRQAGLFDDVAALGVAFLAVDYPGYGRSGGEPSEAANLQAAGAALDWARESHPGRPAVVFGWSLGAAVGVQLAALRPQEVDALVAVSPWTSLAEVARAHFPAWLVRAALRERYDSRAAAAGVRCPVLVVHGELDSIIPAAQGRALAVALGTRARFVSVPGAGHNDVLAAPAVWSEVRGFLARLG
jgi:pimeloyl-ACP methyl ester carboxylesterase